MRGLYLLCLLSLLCVSQAGAKPKWATNGTTAIQVNKVEEITSWEKLGPFIRVDGEAEEHFKSAQKALQSLDYKAVVLHVQMRNDSSQSRELGYSLEGLGGAGVGWLWLRGEEGTERPSRHCFDIAKLSTADENMAAAGITGNLKGNLAQCALTPPKGIIAGRVVIFVPKWFVPVKLFIRSGKGSVYKNFGASEVAVDLPAKK